MKTEDFIKLLTAQAKKNDGVISEDEQNILESIRDLGPEADRLAIYLEVIKAIYRDGVLKEDEGDIVSFARAKLKIRDTEHQQALMKLGFI